MIKRIVKLTFDPTKLDEFMEVFHASKDKIRAFDGCHHMELLQNTAQPEVMFTFSIWDSENALNKYRHSDLFKATWEKTKKCFGGKPEAWSVKLVDGMPNE